MKISDTMSLAKGATGGAPYLRLKLFLGGLTFQVLNIGHC